MVFTRYDVNGACYMSYIFILYLSNFGNPQLLINVKNQGGDVLQETISSNVTEDAVTLEFQRSDGTLVTQLVDFRNDVQILKALVLGEEERGQSQYQVMCFVRHFHKGDFISADAMAKLRQKNPGTVRIPEEDRGRENFTMDLLVDVNKSSVISHQLLSMCGEAGDATYTREQDIQLWASRPAKMQASAGRSEKQNFTPRQDLQQLLTFLPKGSWSEVPCTAKFCASMSALLNAVSRSPPEEIHIPVPRCLETADPWRSCMCHLELCVGWYPCGLKYCKGKDRTAAGYRCGIKTCRKCSLLSYFVQHKQYCLWDE